MKLCLLIVGLALVAVSTADEDDGKCVAKGTKCPNDETAANSCKDKRCSSYKATDKCDAAKCTWATSLCAETCPSFTTKSTCKPDGDCTFTADCGCPAQFDTCDGEGCGRAPTCGTLCEAKPTEALCTKEADDKCNWDGTCKDDARTCAGEATECNAIRGCMYSDVNNACEEIVCTGKAADVCTGFCRAECVTKDDCTVGKCTNTAPGVCALQSTELDCDEESDCKWDEAQCEDKGDETCSEITDEHMCCADTKMCEWQTCAGTEGLLINMLIVCLLPLGALLMQ